MQLDLLADTPRARRGDPHTSHKSASRIKASGALGRQQRKVLDLVRRYPGHTSAELASVYALEGSDSSSWALYRPMIARRLPELDPLHIRRGESRLCGTCGAESVTWWPR